MDLTETNVTTVMNSVLLATYPPEYETDDKIVRGVYNSYLLSDTEGNRQNITDMVMALPTIFLRSQSDAGNDSSFLNACDRADGVRWSQDYTVIEKLFVLGLAIGLVGETWPRDAWTDLPGSVPYYVVIDITEDWAGV